MKSQGKKSKKIFSYRLFHGMPFKEIANKLRISSDSARMNYLRTRKSLKESIKEYQKRRVNIMFCNSIEEYSFIISGKRTRLEGEKAVTKTHQKV